MAMYAVDSNRQPMKATGIVEPVREWVEHPDGRRRPSDRQARSEETGMPLWAVEVLYLQTSFGRSSTLTAKVTVGAVDEPALPDMTPVIFDGLRVEIRTNKAGGFTESWAADGLADPATSPTASQKTLTSGPAKSTAA